MAKIFKARKLTQKYQKLICRENVHNQAQFFFFFLYLAFGFDSSLYSGSISLRVKVCHRQHCREFGFSLRIQRQDNINFK